MRSKTLPLKADPFGECVKIIIPTDTENSQQEFLAAVKCINPDLQDLIFMALILNFRNVLSNIALTNLSKQIKFTKPNIIEDFPDELIIKFVRNFYRFKANDMTYLGTLTKNLAMSIPLKHMNEFIDNLFLRNVFALDKETIPICVMRSPDAMTSFIQHFVQSQDYSKTFQNVLTSLMCPKFDHNILASIILLFLSDCLKIDSKCFSSFISYFSRAVSFIPYNESMDIKQYALLYFQNIFIVRPEVKTIVVGVLKERMKNRMLTPNEAIIMIHTHDDYSIHDIAEAAISKGGPISILNHISMKNVMNPIYGDLLDILLPASICLMKVTNRHIQTITTTIPDLKKFYYLPNVLTACLNINRVPIISAYAIYQPVASCLLHIVSIFGTTKKSLLKPIEDDFRIYPDSALTALFIMASSNYVQDINTFKRVAKAIIKNSIKSDFKQKVSGCEFNKTIRHFIDLKMTDNESVQKFILKCFVYKHKMALKPSKVIKDIEKLKPLKLRQQQEMEKQMEEQSDDEDDLDNVKTPREFYQPTDDLTTIAEPGISKKSDIPKQKIESPKKSPVSTFTFETPQQPIQQEKPKQEQKQPEQKVEQKQTEQKVTIQKPPEEKPAKPPVSTGSNLRNSKTQEYVVEKLPNFDPNLTDKKETPQTPKKVTVEVPKETQQQQQQQGQRGIIKGFFGMFNFLRNIASNDVFEEEKTTEEKPLKLEKKPNAPGNANAVQKSQPVFKNIEISDEELSLSVDEELEAPSINLSEEESSESEPLDDLQSIYAK